MCHIKFVKNGGTVKVLMKPRKGDNWQEKTYKPGVSKEQAKKLLDQVESFADKPGFPKKLSPAKQKSLAKMASDFIPPGKRGSWQWVLDMDSQPGSENEDTLSSGLDCPSLDEYTEEDVQELCAELQMSTEAREALRKANIDGGKLLDLTKPELKKVRE